ncbi:nitrate ABC transporter permease [Chamaesiphon minutus]|uniref:Nitrate ABC transporter, permease protein n=1 Tax=Chamaesiphon minutus (strain ATCC 27169 / PCC 6605) TaxID=1173020 RepID=K9UE76_CHAP6|nr:nitrate ABC transporter permease [Chamaesiphon minutus]AFY93412.1 nitrate ABC transporter, permease protein [Chamaesiphon minutus PCC 6605]
MARTIARPQASTLDRLLSNRKTRKVVAPLIAISVILIIWQLLTLSPDANLPSPLKVVEQTWELIVNPFFDKGATNKGLFWQIWASVQRVLQGFTLAAIVGVSIGIIIGTNEFLFDAFDPIFQILRTIPPLAWLPIALATFQQSNPSAIFVIFITSIWPIILNTIAGVQQIPQDYVNVSKVLQLSRKEYFLDVVFPATVPYIFTGLRIGVGLSWLAIVAAEMLIGGVGIGFFIWDAWNAANISQIIIALIYVGVVGLLLDKSIAFIATKVVPDEQK